MTTQQTITKIAIFQKKEIRKIFHKNEWWFSVSDVIEVLTDSTDVRQYVKRMRQRDSELNSYWGTICTPLEMTAKDGKKRKITSANTEGIFRIIQSIPSPKAEPFKRWLKCEEYDPVDEGVLLDVHKNILIQKINQSLWWHVTPADPDAYKKRGKFLASTYAQAEFYGRPNDNPEKIKISNPLCEISEVQILKRLFPQEYQSLFFDVTVNSTEDYYQKRIELDAKIYQQAKRLGYDAVVLLGKGSFKQIALNKKPRSIELNLCM